MFLILFAAFLLWCLISPFYPDKSPVALTPEQVEAKRAQIEAFQHASASVFDLVWPLAICLLLFLAACFFLKRFLP